MSEYVIGSRESLLLTISLSGDSIQMTMKDLSLYPEISACLMVIREAAFCSGLWDAYL